MPSFKQLFADAGDGSGKGVMKAAVYYENGGPDALQGLLKWL